MLFHMERRLHINKHSKNADTGTLYTMNHPQLANKKTDYGTTYLGTNPIQQKCQHQYHTQILCPSRQKHFLKDHKLRRIFNYNTIKISYTCMNNTKQIINNHNKCILNSSKHMDDTADNTNTRDTLIYY